MNRSVFCTLILLNIFLFYTTHAQNKSVLSAKKDIVQLINKNFKNAEDQYKYFMQQIPDDKFPRSLDVNGNLTTSNSSWWCSGFYPGTLFYLIENSKDVSLNEEALKYLKMLEKEQYNKGTHDLGFMMYCSFGHANKLDPREGYKEILINSAKSLRSRFDPEVGSIRSWNSKNKPSEFLVIIDNMMNLELLFYATRVTGDSSYYKVAVTHANTTMENHFRSDYSSYHVVDYNRQTRTINKKRTHQGAFDESSWARGQAWALYGYVVMYRETKEIKYLNMANNIASFILKHPRLPKDKIPYWDFDDNTIPKTFRDASAAAIIASTLVELTKYTSNIISRNYLDVAEKIIINLSKPTYMAKVGENGGFLLKHSVGSLPHKSEVDVPLTYADYYFVEAMHRYRQLK